MKAQNCLFGEWNEWHGCDRDSPNQGYRARHIVQHANKQGRPCRGILGETKMCPGQPCLFGDWDSWTGCDDKSPYEKRRQRHVVQYQVGHGAHCEGVTYQLLACSEADPTKPGEDCKFGHWGAWGGCSEKIPNQMYRERSIAQPASGGGAQCEGDRAETTACPKGDPCKFAAWGDWEGCNADCPKQQWRKRIIAEHINGTQDGTQCEGVLYVTKGCPMPAPEERLYADGGPMATVTDERQGDERQGDGGAAPLPGAPLASATQVAGVLICAVVGSGAIFLATRSWRRRDTSPGSLQLALSTEELIESGVAGPSAAE